METIGTLFLAVLCRSFRLLASVASLLTTIRMLAPESLSAEKP